MQKRRKMRFLQVILTLLAVTVVWGGPNYSPAAAPESKPKGRVNLVIAGQAGAAVSSYHEWARELGKAGVRNVRIRAARSSDKIAIQTRGSGQYPTYDVTGMIESGGDLVLPGARFSMGDARRVAQWVDDLAQEGPPQSREPKGPFGLTKSQFEKVTDDLGRVVDFSTVGLARAAVVEKITDSLKIPLKIETGLKASLARDKLKDELAGFSSGTALALVLRPLGLGLVPGETDDRRLAYVVLPLPANATGGTTIGANAKTKTKANGWPVGWPPTGPRNKVLPGLFEFHTVGIQNVSLGEVLKAVGKKLDAPLLVDRAALARRGIGPEKINVSLPQRRTTYGLVLNRVLSKAKLKYELRVDEAGRAFLWVTTEK